eukprot:CAMPEP_0201104988 /NCGR_PEP_ID=MMETSP0812-20130820/42561_1 /ASSEMBLY_ACC=CAM_ASM_000668 /TAXON_ID=98059 /ORGANISM="Dinobryon sp., Strain UTEXLB2267" /LENGTH=49 /DNA_ID= /DNA_START= /DNA_END= /DNA_ORIENTATION=
MPTDWTIAPNNADTRYVSSYYTWGTFYMTLSDGSMYITSSYSGNYFTSG